MDNSTVQWLIKWHKSTCPPVTQTEEKALLQGGVDSVVFFTFDFEVVSSKTVGLEVEGQRCVGLIQEQVDAGQLNAVPLKHWS